jgi:hypothetical protein
MTSKVQTNLDLVWGAEAIAKEMNASRRQVYRMLENGQIPGAKRLNRQWVVSRLKLLEFFEIAA